MKITLLNTSKLTAYGTFEYKSISLSNAKELVKNAEVISAIGHNSTAKFLSQLFDIDVKKDRSDFVQGIDDDALVFKLKSRIAEGRIIEEFEEFAAIGYEFGILRRLK